MATRYKVWPCILLLILECAYIWWFYQPLSLRTQAGMMLILALEFSYVMKIARENVRLKQVTGSVPRTSRIYTIIFGLSLFAVLGLLSNWTTLGELKLVWIGVFLVSAYGKIMWHQRDKFEFSRIVS